MAYLKLYVIFIINHKKLDEMNIFKSVINWNNKNNGTNLLNYGVLIVVLNLVVFAYLFPNHKMWELFHMLGFSVAFLGMVGKSICLVCNIEFRIIKYFFVGFTIINIIVFLVFMSNLFTIITSF